MKHSDTALSFLVSWYQYRSNMRHRCKLCHRWGTSPKNRVLRTWGYMESHPLLLYNMNQHDMSEDSGNQQKQLCWSRSWRVKPLKQPLGVETRNISSLCPSLKRCLANFTNKQMESSSDLRLQLRTPSRFAYFRTFSAASGCVSLLILVVLLNPLDPVINLSGLVCNTHQRHAF